METKKKKGATDNVLATRGFAAMCEPRTRSNLERSYFLPVVEGAKGTWEMHGEFSAASDSWHRRICLTGITYGMETLEKAL